MRHARRHEKTSGTLSFNATPMVDVIFMLTIFFMLVTRFSSAEQIPMELPEPNDSRATVPSFPERIVINCRLAGVTDPPDGAVLYSIGPNRPETLGAISDRLAAIKLASPNTKVIIRADRRLRYAEVRAVMRLIARHGIEMLNVVAHVAEAQ